MYETIKYDLHGGGIAVVSLARPEIRNAIGLTMTNELDAAFSRACQDHDVRVIVLRAEGAHFSSGHDLGSDLHMRDLAKRGYAPGPAGDFEKWSELDTEMCLRWRQLPKPLICGLKGYCIYHATALAAVADIALAADDMKYMPSLIEYNNLPHEVGLSTKRAKEILFLQVLVVALGARLMCSPHVLA